ncbi:twin-arginine translocation signal domain-containing protein [Halorubrum sp. DTA46]|uniref:twin-arginine translocation signal domain-containing protein n=1 Tax=Halorubrum sp. DTA46 TaxID=3402162 RepID=UPI003AAFBE18
MEPDSSDDVRTRRTGRRRFLKGLGAAAAAGGALAYDNGPVQESEAFAPLAAYGAVAAGSFVAGAVGGIAAGSILSDVDEEEVEDALDYNGLINEFTRQRESELSDEELKASLQRDVQLVQNKAREEAIFAIYEQGVDSGTASEAEQAAIDAIDEAYATVERSLVNSWHLRVTRLEKLIERIKDDDNPDWGYGSDLYIPESPRSNTTHTQNLPWENFEVTLLDGEQITYRGFTLREEQGQYDDVHISNTCAVHPDQYEQERDWTDNDNGGEFVYGIEWSQPDADDFETVDDGVDLPYNRVTLYNCKEWYDIFVDLYDEHDAMISEVSSMVDTYFQPAQDGEIDLHETIGPKHLTDTAADATDYQEAAMAMRAMGYPVSHQVVNISVPLGDDYDGDEEDEDERLELTGRLSWTAHSGNALTVGTEYDPDDVVGSIFAALNMPDDAESDAEILEVTGPFVIESAEGADEVTFEERDLVESDTEMTNEEIVDLFHQHYEANTEATENVHDTAGGGGGGLPEWGELTNTEKGAAAVVAGLLGYGIFSN